MSTINEYKGEKNEPKKLISTKRGSNESLNVDNYDNRYYNVHYYHILDYAGTITCISTYNGFLLGSCSHKQEKNHGQLNSY